MTPWPNLASLLQRYTNTIFSIFLVQWLNLILAVTGNLFLALLFLVSSHCAVMMQFMQWLCNKRSKVSSCAVAMQYVQSLCKLCKTDATTAIAMQ